MRRGEAWCKGLAAPCPSADLIPVRSPVAASVHTCFGVAQGGGFEPALAGLNSVAEAWVSCRSLFLQKPEASAKAGSLEQGKRAGHGACRLRRSKGEGREGCVCVGAGLGAV